MACRRLMWLPMFGALFVVSRSPGVVEEPADGLIYIAQAEAIRTGGMPTGRYPPGLGFVLAAGDLIGLDPWGAVKLIAIALVILVVMAARRLGGPEAGAVAGLLCCMSPWLAGSGRFIMADPLAAALAVAGLLAVTAGRGGWAVVASVAGVLARLFSGVGVIALLPLGRRFVVAAAFAAVLLFGAFQWAASGSPFRTGYEHGGAKWALANVAGEPWSGDSGWLVDGAAAKSTMPPHPDQRLLWPNILAYPLTVTGVVFVFLPPFLAMIGLSAMWARRTTVAARYAWWWLIGSLALVLPYFFQSPRFLAPAMMLVLVYTAVGVVDLLGADAEHREDREVESGRPLDVRRSA